MCLLYGKGMRANIVEFDESKWDEVKMCGRIQCLCDQIGIANRSEHSLENEWQSEMIMVIL